MTKIVFEDEIEIEQNKFSKRLKQIRTHKKLSQTDLAKRTGFEPSNISHFECGRRSPNLRSIHILCSALFVSPNELLGWSVYPKNK